MRLFPDSELPRGLASVWLISTALGPSTEQMSATLRRQKSLMVLSTAWSCDFPNGSSFPSLQHGCAQGGDWIIFLQFDVNEGCQTA